MLRLAAALVAASVLIPGAVAARPINVLAAENFYGEAASAIGGDRVAVTNVLVAPGTDPHDYEPTPAVAAEIADADIVIVNGAGYDAWAGRLIEASSNASRVVVDVGALLGRKAGDNPHLWYDPAAMPAAAKAIAAALAKADPTNAADYGRNRDAYLAAVAPIAERAAALRARFAGTPAVATEPVFGYMAEALGLVMQNQSFQNAIMNETEPAAQDVAAVEDALRTHAVKVLFYNPQVEDAFTKSLAAIAEKAGVPVVPVTETKPDGKSFVDWQLETLEATAAALEKGSS